jgi:CubicO group peptidase (beta-lactamase class C family)
MDPEATPSAAVFPKTGNLETRSRFAAAYRVLEDAIRDHAFPGCAFGILAGGKSELGQTGTIFTDALGRFTYDEGAPPVTAETAFDVASLTKVVATTAAAMLLHQRGRLNLDLPLAGLLPDFVAGCEANDPARRVTLRHLLAHSSGLPGYVEFFRTARTPEALLDACLRLPLQAEPGTRAEYSDPGFILLGKALETTIHGTVIHETVMPGTVKKESLDIENLASWTAGEIFRPLAMTSTRFRPPESTRAEIPPTEMDDTFRHRRIQGEVQDENAFVLGGVAGHAGLFSNVPDLLRFAGEILSAEKRASGTRAADKGEVGSGKAGGIFAPETIETFSARQSPPGSSRALGWDTPSENSSSGHHFSPHSIGHLGYSGCSLWIDIDAAIAVVLLTNRTWPRRESQRIRQVRPAFHNAVRAALEAGN